MKILNDALGKEIMVGDMVAFSPSEYSTGMISGRVKCITDKGFYIEFQKNDETYIEFVCDVLHIDVGI